jgi:hypothetical protein
MRNDRVMWKMLAASRLPIAEAGFQRLVQISSAAAISTAPISGRTADAEQRVQPAEQRAILDERPNSLRLKRRI